MTNGDMIAVILRKAYVVSVLRRGLFLRRNNVVVILLRVSRAGNNVIPEVTRFPLVCFFPGCDSVILEHQVKFLARGENDLSLYYRNKQLSKAYQSTRRTVIHCPHCQHPRQFVSSSNPSEHILRCKDCGHTYYCVTNGKSLEAVVLERETLQAVEIMGYIEGVGYRDGWGLCPHCNRLLSGGDSYADGELIRCVCGSDLLWKHATDRVKRISRHVRQGMNTDMP